MDKRLLRKHYQELDKEQLIELLIKSREEIEILRDESEKFRIIKRQRRKIKKAIAFIDFYTQGRQYMTENEKELLRLLTTGKGTILIGKKKGE